MSLSDRLRLCRTVRASIARVKSLERRCFKIVSQRSRSLNESNETGSRKFLVILVRYYDDSKMKVVTEIYRLPQLEDGKASTLEDILCDFLKQDELSTEKLLTIMTDSPAVMTGTKTEFLKRMRDHCPHLLDLGRCMLHHVSNAVNYATERPGRNAKELIDDLYHYFLSSVDGHPTTESWK